MAPALLADGVGQKLVLLLYLLLSCCSLLLLCPLGYDLAVKGPVLRAGGFYGAGYYHGVGYCHGAACCWNPTQGICPFVIFITSPNSENLIGTSPNRDNPIGPDGHSVSIGQINSSGQVSASLNTSWICDKGNNNSSVHSTDASA